jgi:UPF0755 protein
MQVTITRKIYLISGLIAVILAGLTWAFIANVTHPVGGRSHTVVTDIHRGTPFLTTVDTLHRQGIIRHKTTFYLLAIFKGAAHRIKAGEYEFPPEISPAAVLEKLVQGDIKRYRVTIPEDLSIQEVADRLCEFGLVDRGKFIALTRDRNFIRSLGIDGESLEGYLFPETYYFDRSMSLKEITLRLVEEFWKHITPEMRKQAQTLGLSIREWVTLASMIGKETGYRNEKDLVSAVFHNRLNKGMRLQSDPTAVYNLKDFNGTVTRRHLALATPHNTYQISGLPPGPIANPGLDSLQAALYPAEVNYLYFVAKNDGTHLFSTTYLSHQQAIKKYQHNGKK